MKNNPHSAFNAKITSYFFDSQNIPLESKNILENFDSIIQNVRPLNSKQIQKLPDDIRTLSHQLTDSRSERRLGYMNDSKQLSSYVRYYTWWNLVRLTKLFANLPKKVFPKEDSFCLDIGSGPLTAVTALWLARPELRDLHLTWYCLDVSANSMALGEDVFLSVAAKTAEEATWKIIRVKGSFGEKINKKVHFITCANMLNELDQNSKLPPESQTKKYFEQFLQYGTEDAKCLLIEPGIPKASRTLSLLRYRFIKHGGDIFAPCSHADECPMNGFKAYTGSRNKWCNFAFSTEDAPKKLLKLSERAKLPKERATLSFLAAGFKTEKTNTVGAEKIFSENSPTKNSPVENFSAANSPAKNFSSAGENSANQSNSIFCTVISDEFSLPYHKCGNYACSKLGLTLLQHTEQKTFSSGNIVELSFGKDEQKTANANKTAPAAKKVGNTAKSELAAKKNFSATKKTPDFHSSLKKDEKSGATIIEV